MLACLRPKETLTAQDLAAVGKPTHATTEEAV
jgi:hypothetical protein